MTATTRGWFVDPFGRHEARYISDGRATSLVRDGDKEGDDPPPTDSLSGFQLQPAELHADDSEVPDEYFQGQRFEERWGGSLGYERRQPPLPKNWTDRNIISVFTPLRPSRFQERNYWRHYLPRVFALSVSFTVLLFILVVAVH